MIKEKPVEGHRWKTVVCSTNEARAYFEDKGLTYADITEGDILLLIMMLNKEIKLSNKTGETSAASIHLSKKIVLKKKTNGSIECCYLFMSSHYFTQREAISFNLDGFIGFAGWADQGNVNPLLRAFLKWCDYLADCKEASIDSGWISVKDALPEDQEEVLVCTRSKKGIRNVDKGYWAIDRFIHRGCAEVTHWMPLPELPDRICFK